MKSEPSDLDGGGSSLKEESGDLETEQETREPQASTQVLEETSGDEAAGGDSQL